ncbi:uncharacterized protein PHALS_13442 [Plasmopara halstedii]|uniref:Uncharacterized protein n=1 Tax=Plasmopara halstedii TaxID=4781 RepID=A0A0P1AQ93_PLAHL|nr:uncharacterized protein PHALS_13442 [Plasmopara halstedii]CEG43230.1 hypothetical protein PHALS_13442 [Plasmopara halstedii]|eukprot:XP_024579599.1 hypothetical protein PHALS_13442 [Plasmopara halstedii]
MIVHKERLVANYHRSEYLEAWVPLKENANSEETTCGSHSCTKYGDPKRVSETLTRQKNLRAGRGSRNTTMALLMARERKESGLTDGSMIKVFPDIDKFYFLV